MKVPSASPRFEPLPRAPDVFQAGHVVVVDLLGALSMEVVLMGPTSEARLLWDGYEIRRLAVCHA